PEPLVEPEPEPEPEVEAELEAVVEPEPVVEAEREAVVESEPEPEPEAVVASEPEPEPEAPAPVPHAGPEVRWDATAFTRPPEPAPEPAHAPEPEPASAVVEPEPTPNPAPAPEPAPVPPTPAPAPAATHPAPRPAARAAEADPAPRIPPIVEFTTPRGPRLILTALLILAAIAAGAAIWRAAETQVGTDIGIAAALTALALVFWWGLAATPNRQVAVRGGILEIEDGTSRYTFDLRNPAVRVDVEGTPGSRGWRVIIHRHRLAPYVLTRHVVDPHRFTEVLEHYRALARRSEELRLARRRA